jgi:hypothetical protein
MPKIAASMADISTEFVLPDPGLYELEIVEIKDNTATQKAPQSGQEVERVTYVVKSKIIQDEHGGDDHANKPLYDYINIHTKEGELNQISLANLKRYFEAIAPDSANSDDADTDELVGGRFMAMVYHDTYKRNDGSEGVSAKIKATTIHAVS